MEIQRFIRRARGRYSKVSMHGGKDTVTIVAVMPIEISFPLNAVRKYDWDDIVGLVDDKVWEQFLRLKPKEDS